MLVCVAVLEYLEHSIVLAHLKHFLATPEIVLQLICAAKWTIARLANHVDFFEQHSWEEQKNANK